MTKLCTESADTKLGELAVSGRRQETYQRILDTAERLIQMRGYNAVSYADIGSSLRLTNASLHYHFPSKSDLGTRLMERYTQSFLGALANIDATSSRAGEKLARYVAIYSDVLANDRMCLCGMLAAEYATLPKALKVAVTAFFDANEKWLAAVLESGADAGELRVDGSAKEAARVLVAGLEGAMMVARAYGDPSRFKRAAQHLLAQVRAAA
jgi:TetR/AcrR family transcriptional regulator, transcriptional repressor for nem operon